MRAIFSLLALAIVTQQPPPADPDWGWLENARPAALEALMPMATSGLIVGYRSYRDLYHDVHERYFRISGSGLPVERYTAIVVVPLRASIQQQLLVLHAQKPQASVESLLASVSVRRLAVTEVECPAIRVRLDALSRTPFVNPHGDALHLHPTLHRIRIGLLSAEIDATLHDDKNPLVRWAEETMLLLLACGPG